MGLSITWVTVTILWFFFFFGTNILSKSTTAGVCRLLCTLEVPQEDGLKNYMHEFWVAHGKQLSLTVLSLLSLPCQLWQRNGGDLTLGTTPPYTSVQESHAYCGRGRYSIILKRIQGRGKGVNCPVTCSIFCFGMTHHSY